MPQTERCPKCAKVKDASEFSPGNRRCRPCKAEQALAAYWSDGEKREKQKAYHRENERRKRADPEKNAVILARLREKRATKPEWRARQLRAVNERRRKYIGRNLAITAKKRAKEKQIECTITPEQIQAEWERAPHCVYCSRELRPGSGKFAEESPTLDRMDCTKGYTPDNTALACFRCNTLKRDASLEELETLVANIRRVRSK